MVDSRCLFCLPVLDCLIVDGVVVVGELHNYSQQSEIARPFRSDYVMVRVVFLLLFEWFGHMASVVVAFACSLCLCCCGNLLYVFKWVLVVVVHGVSREIVVSRRIMHPL